MQLNHQNLVNYFKTTGKYIPQIDGKKLAKSGYDAVENEPADGVNSQEEWEYFFQSSGINGRPPSAIEAVSPDFATIILQSDSHWIDTLYGNKKEYGNYLGKIIESNQYLNALINDNKNIKLLSFDKENPVRFVVQALSDMRFYSMRSDLFSWAAQLVLVKDVSVQEQNDLIDLLFKNYAAEEEESSTQILYELHNIVIGNSLSPQTKKEIFARFDLLPALRFPSQIRAFNKMNTIRIVQENDLVKQDELLRSFLATFLRSSEVSGFDESLVYLASHLNNATSLEKLQLALMTHIDANNPEPAIMPYIALSYIVGNSALPKSSISKITEFLENIVVNKSEKTTRTTPYDDTNYHQRKWALIALSKCVITLGKQQHSYAQELVNKMMNYHEELIPLMSNKIDCFKTEESLCNGHLFEINMLTFYLNLGSKGFLNKRQHEKIINLVMERLITNYSNLNRSISSWVKSRVKRDDIVNSVFFVLHKLLDQNKTDTRIKEKIELFVSNFLMIILPSTKLMSDQSGDVFRRLPKSEQDKIITVYKQNIKKTSIVFTGILDILFPTDLDWYINEVLPLMYGQVKVEKFENLARAYISKVNRSINAFDPLDLDLGFLRKTFFYESEPGFLKLKWNYRDCYNKLPHQIKSCFDAFDEFEESLLVFCPLLQIQSLIQSPFLPEAAKQEHLFKMLMFQYKNVDNLRINGIQEIRLDEFIKNNTEFLKPYEKEILRDSTNKEFQLNYILVVKKDDTVLVNCLYSEFIANNEFNVLLRNLDVIVGQDEAKCIDIVNQYIRYLGTIENIENVTADLKENCKKIQNFLRKNPILLKRVVDILDVKNSNSTNFLLLELERVIFNEYQPLKGDRFLFNQLKDLVSIKIESHNIKESVTIYLRLTNTTAFISKDRRKIYQFFARFLGNQIVKHLLKTNQTHQGWASEMQMNSVELNDFLQVLEKDKIFLSERPSDIQKFWNNVKKGNFSYGLTRVSQKVQSKLEEYAASLGLSEIFQRYNNNGQKFDNQQPSISHVEFKPFTDYQVGAGFTIQNMVNDQGDVVGTLFKVNSKMAKAHVLVKPGKPVQRSQAEILYPGLVMQTTGTYTTDDGKPTDIVFMNGELVSFNISEREGLIVVNDKGEIIPLNLRSFKISDLIPEENSKKELKIFENLDDFNELLQLIEKHKLSAVQGHLLYYKGESMLYKNAKNDLANRRVLVTFPDKSYGIFVLKEPGRFLDLVDIAKQLNVESMFNLDTGTYDFMAVYDYPNQQAHNIGSGKDDSSTKIAIELCPQKIAQ